jgi:hypothetical protein
MDVIREHLMYKNSPITVCMKDLSPQEHYEIIRIILESEKDNVTICKHEFVSPYIEILLSKLKVKFVECWKVAQSVKTF